MFDASCFAQSTWIIQGLSTVRGGYEGHQWGNQQAPGVDHFYDLSNLDMASRHLEVYVCIPDPCYPPLFPYHFMSCLHFNKIEAGSRPWCGICSPRPPQPSLVVPLISMSMGFLDTSQAKDSARSKGLTYM